MSGSALLDTNVVIRIFNADPQTEEWLLSYHEVYLSSVVIGELLYGAMKSSHRDANLQRIAELADSLPVLPVNLETSHHYGDIKDRLRRNGRMAPENDIWVAATAAQYGLTVVTFDHHFEHMDGLSIDLR